MAKRNDDFFIKKKPWSEVKDELLGCYFSPYVSKILHTRRPLVYVDCFAGKGQFDDGKPGSPLIALKILNRCCMNTKLEQPADISTCFIDLNYADDLMKNLSDYPNVNIISGRYEEKIEQYLSKKDKCNVFLYIDPYGIKALQCSLFDRFSQYGFHSIELLINFNSFGFIREACHAVGASYDDVNVFDDLIEYEPTYLDASEKSIEELNEIAGGDYWQEIINSYKQKKIDGYEAEVLFSEKYCERLKKSYKYVLNMPLRIKIGQRPKYRMIHATNHRDGCLLMVDNICNRWEALQNIQNSGQALLWEEGLENQCLDNDDITKRIMKHLSNYLEWISLHDALADFFVEHGTICSTKITREIVNNLVSSGHIEVRRIPCFTRNGKPSKFLTETRKQQVNIRWLK